MNYNLIRELISLAEEFDTRAPENNYPKDLEGFKHWLSAGNGKNPDSRNEPHWEGKESGRSPESAISTLLVHMNRYAKNYSRAAIYGSAFSTQDDFIYLINLKAFGAMTKMELIKKNIQDKPTGMLIINRLIQNNWVEQAGSPSDKRSKIIALTAIGAEALEQQMDKIRQATKIVTGTLTAAEKIELICLLQKLDDFHHGIYQKNFNAKELLTKAHEDLIFSIKQTA